MNTAFFLDSIPTPTITLLKQFVHGKADFLRTFYLSGGTALSFQIGHRESEDLDFFSESPFDPQKIEQQLLPFGSLSQTELLKGTLNTYIGGVKLQFLEYPYPLIEPCTQWETVQFSSLADIACTKLQTVGMRGSKKDFIDIFYLLKQFSLETLLSMSRQKYTGQDYSETHMLKSLIYFADADAQPMPRMHQEVSWETVKKTLVSAVKTISLL